ncbi:Tc toxin subunit A [Pseudomonas coleopterorum]|uniref:Tc toxin subunit A n=1 Tax=Pseudomonas coleopterorum TaxID=1605838 RepID=UPI002A6B6A5D|nr:Tc toxin subunit A [Pseudomonas coleopterorum]MDY1049433.1 Tc toxin subunit A [Pseudomonas coleopterorum]
MNTPELPEPIFDNGEDLTPEIELPTQPDPVYNPLFENLVPEEPETHLAGRLSFADAMPRMGMSSVFDIIRQPKGEFARQLRTLSDADGEMAYDNALCYATQIARSYREDVVSSGRDLPSIAPQTGVRALVEVGPSYPNLFKENWDQFCKVGAIEAMDGPVAYLGSLRRFAAERIEGASTSPKRIPLAVRRPDLDKLVIDEQSTYQSRPMLDLVNDVLTQGIDKYQAEKGDARPIHQLLAEKKHPFVFPYHFAHQQVSLALGGEKPALGEISYALGISGQEQAITLDSALPLLSGLSPVQQLLLTRPSPFAALSRVLSGAAWSSPVQSNTYPWAVSNTYFEVPEQPAVLSVTHRTSDSLIVMSLQQGDVAKTVSLRAYSTRETAGGSWPLHVAHRDYPSGVCVCIGYDPADNDGAALEGEFHAPLLIDMIITTDGWKRIGRRLSVDIFTGSVDHHSRNLTDEETLFLREHYGMEQTSFGQSELSQVSTFCQATGLDADQLQALIAQKDAFPRLSPNCPMGNPTGGDAPLKRPPSPMNYGAVYVNGVGGQDLYAAAENAQLYNNGLTFWQGSGAAALQLGNTCLDRFDRLQRMIRLQRWMNIPFAELDILIVSAMRAEGNANPGLQLNQNTLRTLGAYRYFSRNFGIGAEEFAAFLHDITPFASGDKASLFDRVFNSPVLFGAPLRLDRTTFTQTTSDMASQKTIGQLCAGLGLLPDVTSFGVLAANTIAHVGPLNRSLPIVSAMYRQARIADLFSLNVADLDYLLRLLGGVEFVRKCTAGLLLPREADAATEADVLDILMKLDESVRWLKANKLTVSQLRDMMEAGPVPVAAPGLLDRLQQLAGDARTQAVTAHAVAALNLPGKSTGAAIDWFAELGKGAQALIDARGLVNAPTLTLEDSDSAQLTAKVTALVESQGLAASAKPAAITVLSEFLLDTLTQQTRLVEALLQEHTTLLPELAVLVGRCAEVSPQQLLTGVLQAWPATGAASEAGIAAVLAQLHQANTCAKALSWVGIGAKALRTLLVNPAWLGTAKLWPLSLDNLRAFKAYDGLFDTLGQPEERLLGYLAQANALFSNRPGKRQLAVQAQTCNAAMATLLGWSETEVAALTELLPQKTAKTVVHIDWLRRAQALSLETGLNAATLLQACSLTAESPEADWQAVGQAAMAAVRA